jgi:SCY1-like protein 1
VLQVTGFTDVAPVVREQTVKAVLTIINKLSDRTINGELLKYLAKTSNDEQPGIRTNTTICLGKISKNLGVSTRSKVLIAAFTRSLRDPFVHARNAALMALAVTSDAFSDDDCANRLLPALCPLLIDKEKLIRDQTNKTMDIYMQRIRKLASTMSDSALPPSNTEGSLASAPRMGTPASSEAASWTGWAISSFTNKVSAAAGEITSTANGTHPEPSRSSSAPTNADLRRPLTTASASASVLHRQAVTSPPISSARTSISSNTNEYFHDSNDGQENEDIDIDDAWGDMQDDPFFESSETTTAWNADKSTSAPSASTPSASAANPFDDNGEPDFAGWLAAQAGKKTTTKPLPKGLTKSAANGRPAQAGRVVTTGSVGGAGAKKAASTAPKPVVAKKINTAPKDTGEEDGWGDGW